jgi:hypothetical protein
VDNQHILAWYLKIMGQILQGRPAAVHKGHGLGQQNVDIFDIAPPKNGVEFGFIKRNAEIQRNFVGHHEAGIMPGVFVFISRIAESDNQSKSICGHIVDALFFFFRLCFSFGGLSFGTFFTFLEFFFPFFGDFFFDHRAENGDNRIIHIGINFHILSQGNVR